MKTASVDPDRPIRGRYLTLSLQVHAQDLSTGQKPKNDYTWTPVYLTVENNQLVAHRVTGNTNFSITPLGRGTRQAGSGVYFLSPPIAFFCPNMLKGL